MTNVVSDSKLARREQARHYIPASEEEIASMLKQVGRNSFEALFDHIPSAVLFSEKLDLPEELAYKDLRENYSKSRQRIKVHLAFLEMVY